MSLEFFERPLEQPSFQRATLPSAAWQSAICSLLANEQLSPSLKTRKRLLTLGINGSTIQRFQLKETHRVKTLSCVSNGEITALHIPCGLLIPELGLSGEILGLQCQVSGSGEHSGLQRIFNGAEARPHFIGADQYRSLDELCGNLLSKRALVVTQSSLEALALYQAARKDVAVVSIGSLPLLPIDPLILRLGEQMPVLLMHRGDAAGQAWHQRWRGARRNKRRNQAFEQLRSLIWPQHASDGTFVLTEGVSDLRSWLNDQLRSK